MNLELTDKVIIVTGGAKGIGEGIVKVLAAEGAIPVIIGRSEADNLKVVREVEASGGKAFQVVAELIDPIANENAIKTDVAKYGRMAW
jgi:L-fucose dehydrogenase